MKNQFLFILKDIHVLSGVLICMIVAFIVINPPSTAGKHNNSTGCPFKKVSHQQPNNKKVLNPSV